MSIKVKGLTSVIKTSVAVLTLTLTLTFVFTSSAIAGDYKAKPSTFADSYKYIKAGPEWSGKSKMDLV